MKLATLYRLKYIFSVNLIGGISISIRVWHIKPRNFSKFCPLFVSICETGPACNFENAYW